MKKLGLAFLEHIFLACFSFFLEPNGMKSRWTGTYLGRGGRGSVERYGVEWYGTPVNKFSRVGAKYPPNTKFYPYKAHISPLQKDVKVSRNVEGEKTFSLGKSLIYQNVANNEDSCNAVI